MGMEVVRETHGLHPCDRRSTRTELMSLYPEVDFTDVTPDHDALWTMERESLEAISKRALTFLQWLCDRPERCMAVVSHDAFLFAVFGHLAQWPGVDIACYGGARFRNCEVRRVCIPLKQ